MKCLKIGRIHIEGIKSYKRTKFHVENYNVLAGENNSGKSNIISAIRWFFKDKNFKLSKEDINHGFKSDPSITIEFIFEDGDTIPKSFKEEFADKTGKKFLIKAYCNLNDLKEKPQAPNYQILKLYGKPEKISLPKIVDVIFVPSIRQLSDELKLTANSTINKLVTKYVIERVLNDEEKSKKYNQVKEAIKELSDHIGDGDDSAFGELKQSLNKHMLDYGNITLDFTLNPPKPDILIKDSFEPYVNVNGNKSKIDLQGMGYQRSLIFSLICNMAELESKSSTLLNLYLIEEPELFLHPNHQNHFKNRLMQLSRSGNNQIVITSHSPYFLNNIDNYSQVKRISISKYGSKLKEITQEQVSDVCNMNGKLMADAYNHNGRFSPTDLTSKAQEIAIADELRYLLWIDPNRANAFLSKKVLLVEGATEKAFFSFIFNNPNGDFYHNDKKSELMVVDTNGKYHFYKFANLLHLLGIPTWIIHDGDIPTGQTEKISNKLSNRLLNQYIDKLKNDSIILGYKRLDQYIEDYLGIDKEEHTADVSIYQKLEINDNNCRNCTNYSDLMSFVENILDYEV